MNGQPLTAAQAQTVLATLLASHDWQLLTAHELWTCIRARARVADDQSEETVRKLAINCYCEAWYAACCGEGLRRTRAYSELAHYLYDRALYKYGDRTIAQEITHDAILLVARQISQVQQPGAFLAFALLKLWNAATAYFRQRDRQVQRNLPLPDPADDEQPGELADPQSILPETTTLQREFEQRVRARIQLLLLAAPRAYNQLQAVLLKFLEGYSDEEIADVLATDVANVHVLRSRGLHRLRADAELCQLLAEVV